MAGLVSPNQLLLQGSASWPFASAVSQMASRSFDPWTGLHLHPNIFPRKEAGPVRPSSTIVMWERIPGFQPDIRECRLGFRFQDFSPGSVQDVADGGVPRLRPWHLSVTTPFFASVGHTYGNFIVLLCRAKDGKLTQNAAFQVRIPAWNLVFFWITLLLLSMWLRV